MTATAGYANRHYDRVVNDHAAGLVERLIEALAAQIGASGTPALAPGAAAALSELSRDEARLVFGHAGHLVHYGADTAGLETLVRLISEVQRDEADAGDPILPGDEVRLVGELPSNLADYDANWLREATFVVRYVNADGTIDVQPAFTEDFVIETVPMAVVQLTR
ncbi:hypothetical protein ACIBSW_17270 [Actinoplanes sp. NPDC049668]|uniref:hypothetical protein n=1 Tax=unclassified Actinoplanes TaxID=2626549 RepID=UPI0033B58EF3